MNDLMTLKLPFDARGEIERTFGYGAAPVPGRLIAKSKGRAR